MTGPQRHWFHNTALKSSSNPHTLKSSWLQEKYVKSSITWYTCLKRPNSAQVPLLTVSLDWAELKSKKREQIHKEWTHCPLCCSTGCSDCFTHTAGWLIIMGFYAIPLCPPPIELSTPPHPLRAWDALTVISLWQHLDVPSLSRPYYWDDSPENVAIVPKRASDEQLFLSGWKTMKKKEREDRQFSSFPKATPV